MHNISPRYFIQENKNISRQYKIIPCPHSGKSALGDITKCFVGVGTGAGKDVGSEAGGKEGFYMGDIKM